LIPGQDLLYVVRIEAFADPTPQDITEDDLEADIEEAIEKTIEQLRQMSEVEMMDQVYRRLTIHLCPSCYAKWIENPAR